MNYFIYTSHHFTPHGRYKLNKLTSLPVCRFIAQLVEHRTGIAEVMRSNPVEALIFPGVFFPIGHFYSCVLSYLAMNAGEAGGDLALIQTSLLFSCKCHLVRIRTT